MNNNYIVNVYLPSIGENYHVYIPASIKIWHILPLLTSVFQDVTMGRYCGDGNPIFCSMPEGNILDYNLSPYEAGIRNGTKLMLI